MKGSNPIDKVSKQMTVKTKRCLLGDTSKGQFWKRSMNNNAKSPNRGPEAPQLTNRISKYK